MHFKSNFGKTSSLAGVEVNARKRLAGVEVDSRKCPTGVELTLENVGRIRLDARKRLAGVELICSKMQRVGFGCLKLGAFDGV